MSSGVVTDAESLVRERVEELLAKGDASDTTAFWGLQYDLGLAWVHFPQGFGGLGVSPQYQQIVADAVADLGPVGGQRAAAVGLGMSAPTVAVHGTDEQRQRYLRPLFTGEKWWCQLFSEPGSGSDLAGASTRAVRDGDMWVVNGQKVWTSGAHYSDHGTLLARTDPNVPKHNGLTYFIVDMHAPGVDVRPLRQMTGEAEFNEVYFTDVHIPDSDRIGDAGAGWHVAVTTLMNERVAGDRNQPPRGSGVIADAARLWGEHGHNNRARQDELMKLWAANEAVRLTNMRAIEGRKSGMPGPEGSTGKLGRAELNKAITELAVDLMGAAGQLYATYDLVDRPGHPKSGGLTYDPSEDDILQRSFLRARSSSIAGGTSEVMRNILGERVLGLPGDIRTDRDKPWSEVPRN
jgi:alkylation response protein AidB-like acyl-CoA dehydrogenase